MKKITALKNKETGEIVRAIHKDRPDDLTIGEMINYGEGQLIKTPCILIEESELKEIQRQMKEGANNIPNSDWSEGMRDGYRQCLKLLNSLTE